MAAVCCAGCLVAAGLVSRPLLTSGPSAPVADRGRPAFYSVGYRQAGPRGATPGATPGASAFAGRSRVFGLVMPAGAPGMVLFAPARREQPGGPETVLPADVQPYQEIPLAPGAEIRVTAPIANGGVTDYVRGIQVSPERFSALYRESERRYGSFLDRGHMFELWFDGDGRIIRMIHYFSP